ncbi:MAG: NAD(P)/FAD-dependent oxidoreductase [Actinobacteria bacterium]|nr:NAD(P)/FAD-dependent oxidoreductase [Actinomycetota bacterium]
MDDVDAVVVGAGPNGLAAALTLAERGLSVRVFEAAASPGGGARTAELTLPHFAHDICSTVQALALVSPFFRNLALDVQFCAPPIAYAHPLDGGRAGAVYPDVDVTADGLGADGAAWRSIFGPLARQAEHIWPDVLGPLRSVPRHPVSMARFGLPGLLPATTLARRRFHGDAARALLAGAAAHSMRRLDAPLTSAFGLVLALAAQTVNWPVVRGGSGVLVDALVTRLRALGGEVVCSSPVRRLDQLPPSRVTLLDLSPRQLLELAGTRLPVRYRRSLRRFRYGPGVFKLDYALSEPIPWLASECRQAGTLHLGGSWQEIARSEAAVEAGRHSDSPFVLVVQPTLMDPTRAPAGRHVLWAYCHVPSGSTRDMSSVVENQIERFAPGFRDTILARSTRSAAEIQAYDENYVGGDINAGLASLRSALLGPVPAWSRYKTPLPGTYLCSSSTPPGGGVHGMSGMLAAQEALRSL